jgi:phage shock protein A
MGPLEILVMRLVLWIGLPLLLLSLAVGPRRVLRHLKAVWKWFTRRRLDPEEILTHVVRQHEQHVAALGKLVTDEEAAEADIVANLRQSEGQLAALEEQARTLSARGDELGARAALYKLNLERAAMANFGVQLKRQRELIEDSRRRLYELELQLRQYEVGRNILLGQLAAAEKVEQQYAIARQFDPFNAVANWQQAEGLVQQKSLNAKAIERVYADTTDVANAAALSGSSLSVDPAALEAELARLRSQARGSAERAAVKDGAVESKAGESPAASDRPIQPPQQADEPPRQTDGPSDPPPEHRSSVIHLHKPR